ncbi:MAG: hypothetical protein QMD12_03595, partial [Candidatus Aenigmarchaeota archaeon]|nr:hypothetical protein [Candidatus Aenigmarchaeota archaeon]
IDKKTEKIMTAEEMKDMSRKKANVLIKFFLTTLKLLIRASSKLSFFTMIEGRAKIKNQLTKILIIVPKI